MASSDPAAALLQKEQTKLPATAWEKVTYGTPTLPGPSTQNPGPGQGST